MVVDTGRRRRDAEEVIVSAPSRAWGRCGAAKCGTRARGVIERVRGVGTLDMHALWTMHADGRLGPLPRLRRVPGEAVRLQETHFVADIALQLHTVDGQPRAGSALG